jgi:hypothetical protein
MEAESVAAISKAPTTKVIDNSSGSNTFGGGLLGSTKWTAKSFGGGKSKSSNGSSNRRGDVVSTSAAGSSSLYDNDVHVVAGVVKGYLRDGLGPKKEPLCTFALYEGFVEAARK